VRRDTRNWILETGNWKLETGKRMKEIYELDVYQLAEDLYA